MTRKERATEYLKRLISTASYLVRNFDKIDDISQLTMQDVIFAFGQIQSASIDFQYDMKVADESKKDDDN